MPDAIRATTVMILLVFVFEVRSENTSASPLLISCIRRSIGLHKNYGAAVLRFS